MLYNFLWYSCIVIVQKSIEMNYELIVVVINTKKKIKRWKNLNSLALYNLNNNDNAYDDNDVLFKEFLSFFFLI